MDKNVMVVSSWVMSCLMPSQIAPLRLMRAFHAEGWNVLCCQSEHLWLPKKEQGIYKYPWGDCCTVPESELLPAIDQILENVPKPDLFIVANTINSSYYDLAEKHDLIIAPFQSDPYYAGYPSKDGIEAQFGRADLILFNEGNPVNYIKEIHPEIGEKCHIVNHALDLTIAPTDEEVKNSEKEFLVSICSGLELQRHKQFMRLFYFPSLKFPDQKFGVAGSLDVRFKRETMEDPKVGLTDEEVVKYSDYTFPSIKPQSEPLKNPLAGSAAGVEHWNPKTERYEQWFGGGLSWERTHQLYNNSYYGFNAYGDYLTKNPYSYKMFGTKIFEQLGSSAACITNRIGGIEELVQDGKTGFIVETEKEAIDAYQYGVDNPESVRKMGLAARKNILENHTWNHRVRQIEKIVKSL